MEVFRRIKAGKIEAEKVGRNYIISHTSLVEALGRAVGNKKKEEIERVIDRALEEYGDVFKKLGRE